MGVRLHIFCGRVAEIRRNVGNRLAASCGLLRPNRTGRKRTRTGCARRRFFYFHCALPAPAPSATKPLLLPASFFRPCRWGSRLGERCCWRRYGRCPEAPDVRGRVRFLTLLLFFLPLTRFMAFYTLVWGCCSLAKLDPFLFLFLVM